MSCILTSSEKYKQDITNIITFYSKCGESTVLNVISDIYDTEYYIKDCVTSNNLIGSIPDYKYKKYRFFLTPLYNFKIFVKPYPERNLVKTVCIVWKSQIFKPNMFVEQLRQTYKELGGDYDEATRQYLAEQARLASMTEIDKEIELFKMR